MAQLSRYSAILALCLALHGCTWAEWLSIHREASFTNNSRAVFSDAKQRVVTSSTPGENAGYHGYIDPKHILCAEPSPDVAQAVSGSIAATIEAALKRPEAGGQGSAALALATADSIAQLGERLATIQLLRDKAYRACEAYANGAISATTFTLMMSRHDRTMATLLLGEMAAGAFGRRLASISGSASASVMPKLEDLKAALDASAKAATDLKDANTKVEEAKSELEKAEKLPATDTTRPQKIEEAKKKVAATEKTRADALAASLAAEAVLRQRASSATAGGEAATDVGVIAARVGGTAADRVVDLQRQLFDANELSTVLDACVTAADRLPLTEEAKQESAQLRKLETEASKPAPNREQMELLAKGTRLKDQVVRQTDPGVARRLAEGARAKIVEEAPAGAFTRICNDRLPWLFETLANPRTLPSSSIESQKLALETAQAKTKAEYASLCHEIWQATQKPNAPQEVKDQWKTICLPLLAKPEKEKSGG